VGQALKKRRSSVVSKPSPSLGEETQTALLESRALQKVGLSLSGIACRIQKEVLRNLASPHHSTSGMRSRRLLPQRRLVGWSSPCTWLTAPAVALRDWSAGCHSSRSSSTPPGRESHQPGSRPVLNCRSGAAVQIDPTWHLEKLPARRRDGIRSSFAPGRSTICRWGGALFEPASSTGTGVAEPKA